jgi:hypothetical protein
VRFLKGFGLGILHQPLWKAFEEAFPEDAHALQHGTLEDSFGLELSEQTLNPIFDGR